MLVKDKLIQTLQTMNVLFIIIILCGFQHGMVYSQAVGLKFVTALFRHGDRTPEDSETYPKDVYRNISYGGYGPGELTDQGRWNMYQLGKLLKKMYTKDLGNFSISNVKAVSTEYNRTQFSLQLVLNALFNEDEAYDVEKHLKRFDTETAFLRNNSLLSFPIIHCPRFQQIYRQYEKSERFKSIKSKYTSRFSYISEHTGADIQSFQDLVPIYHSLERDKRFGLELPPWLPSIQRYLTSPIGDFSASQVALPGLNKLFGGFLLKEILNNIEIQIKTSKSEKFYLYAGHDINIIGLLGAMGIFRPHNPDYAACIVVELHKIRNNYYLKVRYQQSPTVGFKDLHLTGCSQLCSFETFKRIVRKNIPEESDSCE